MTETKKTVNVKIKSMNGTFATTGAFVAAGKNGKLGIDDVCQMDADAYKAISKSDVFEKTDKAANCKLVNGAVVRD